MEKKEHELSEESEKSPKKQGVFIQTKKGGNFA